MFKRCMLVGLLAGVISVASAAPIDLGFISYSPNGAGSYSLVFNFTNGLVTPDFPITSALNFNNATLNVTLADNTTQTINIGNFAPSLNPFTSNFGQALKALNFAATLSSNVAVAAGGSVLFDSTAISASLSGAGNANGRIQDFSATTIQAQGTFAPGNIQVAVPEPSTLGLSGMALLTLVVAYRRRATI